jgi:hypothetical protein
MSTNAPKVLLRSEQTAGEVAARLPLTDHGQETAHEHSGVVGVAMLPGMLGVMLLRRTEYAQPVFQGLSDVLCEVG